MMVPLICPPVAPGRHRCVARILIEKRRQCDWSYCPAARVSYFVLASHTRTDVSDSPIKEM